MKTRNIVQKLCVPALAFASLVIQFGCVTNLDVLTGHEFQVVVHQHYWDTPLQRKESYSNIFGSGTKIVQVPVLILDVSFENKWTQKIPIECFVLDKQGYVIARNDILGNIKPDEAIFNMELLPDEKIRGKMAFEVPQNSNKLFLGCAKNLKIPIQ